VPDGLDDIARQHAAGLGTADTGRMAHMKKWALTSFVSMLALALAAGAASAQITLNEIRVDHTGTDTDEYVELAGPAGASLAGYQVVVIGDGTGGCGIVEAAIDLSGYTIQPDGVFALRYSGGTAALAGYDANSTGSFENSDNLTFLLVAGFVGTVNQDLDTNNDGVLDLQPWSSIVDEVGLAEGVLPIDCTNNEHLYTGVVVGPDGTFVPGHVFRCGNQWFIGPFGTTWPTGIQDTPGAPNDCAVPTRSSTWGQVKTLYR
jgi:hypothetical protein